MISSLNMTPSSFLAGGHSTFFALLNTFVHIIMYFYYMMTAMGPEYQKYIWWKKYLTTFQMVQFVAIFVHQFQLLFVECNYPKSFMVWIALHGVLFLFLFSDFYKQRYTPKDKVTGKPVNDGACMVSRIANRTVFLGKIKCPVFFQVDGKHLNEL
jgi:GNS1/SUR4 family.